MPDLIIAHGEIIARRSILAGKARHIDVPAAWPPHRQGERKDALFPVCMKDRFVELRLNRAVAVRPAKVLAAVHDPASGGFANPTPIIESRVTRLASFCSLHSSAPFGRSGTTR